MEEDEIEMDEGLETEVAPGRWVRHPPRPKRYTKRRFLHFVNFDGQVFHGDRKHLKHCPKRPPQEQDDAVAAAVAAAGDRCSGNKAWWEGTWGPQAMLRDDQYDMKMAYAAALTNVDPDHLVVTYQIVHECDLFHAKKLPNVNQWNKYTSGAQVRARQRLDVAAGGGSGGSVADKKVAKADAWKFYKTVRDYLATEHPVDSLLGTRYTSFTQDSLVKLILSKPYNSTKDSEDDLGGFLILTGGAEGDVEGEEDGLIRKQFGFVHQRCVLDAEKDVGPFTHFQSVLQHNGDRKAAMETIRRLAAIPGTMSRGSLHDDGRGECISLDMFRFLCQKRKFHSYRIRHYIMFKNKHYLSPFLVSLLQRRWDLRKLPDPSAHALLGNLLKLMGNGEGHTM